MFKKKKKRIDQQADVKRKELKVKCEDCFLLQHIKELSSVFQEIFVNTPSSSIDHATLKQVTHGESPRYDRP